MPNKRDWRYLERRNQARMFPPQEAPEPTTRHAPDFALHFYSNGTQLVAIAVTPSGNVHPLQPQEGTFSFTIADKVVSFQIAPEAMPVRHWTVDEVWGSELDGVDFTGLPDGPRD